MICKAKFTELHLLTNFEIMQKGGKNVFFFFEVEASIRNRKKLKFFVASIFRIEKRPLNSVNYIFCSDKTVRGINKRYLNHDYLTDIITFNLSEKGQALTAEVYISFERVKENAVNNSTTFQSEIHRVIFHGALHLCGYDDKTKTQKQVMRTREDYYLSKYFS